MTKEILVRIADSLKTLTPEQMENLKQLFPGQEIKIERYGHDRPVYKFYEQRQQSIFKAFNLVVETLLPGLSSNIMSYYNDNCTPVTVFPMDDSVQNHQNKLVDYDNFLVSIFAKFAEEERSLSESGHSQFKNWPYGSLKTPSRQFKDHVKRLLETAEHYVILNEGHPDLVTISPTKGGVYRPSDLVMLWDEQIDPFTAETLHELESIKKSDEVAEEATDDAAQKASKKEALKKKNIETCEWFSKLPNAIKLYFHSRHEADTVLKHYQDETLTLLSVWKKQIRENPNFTTDKENIVKGSPLPEWFTSLEECGLILQVFLREKYDVLSVLETIITMVEDFDSKIIEKLNSVKKLPIWFLFLEDFEQLFLRQALTKNNPVDLKFVSSRHRTLPAMSNFGRHRVRILSETFKTLKEFPDRIRSSHQVARDTRHFPKCVSAPYTKRNYQLLERYADKHFPGKHKLLQTLISPLAAILPEDYFLNTQRKEFLDGLDNKETNHVTNHPLNLAQHFIPTDPGCLEFLQTAKNYLKDNPSEEFRLLIDKYETALNTGILRSLDGSAPRLEASSYEELIALFMGILSYGSCVSGKDRKALVLLYSDTHMIYKEKYGKWVDSKDAQSRNDWCEIFASQYKNWHMQTHAGFNAPGSPGIKHPYKYLPADIINLLGMTLLTLDDTIASNNVVKNIHKTSKNHQSSLPYTLEEIIKTIPIAQQELINKELKDIILATNFWKTKTNRFPKMMGVSDKCPEGILKLQKACALTTDPSALLKECVLIVDNRVKINSNRSSCTNDFYQALLPLTNMHIQPFVVVEVIENLRKFKTDNHIKNQEVEPPLWREYSL